MLKTNKLKVWETIGKGFKIPFANPSIFIPSALYSFVWSMYTFFTTAVYQPGEEPDFARALIGALSVSEYVLFTLLALFVSVFGHIVISKMAYDSITGQPDISSAVSLSVKKFIPVIIVSVLYGLIVLFGTVLLIVPGIILGIMLMFSAYLVLFENNGVISSLSASWKLVNGNFLRMFAWLLVWVMILIIPSSLIVNLERTAETIATFIFYSLVWAWFYSSSVVAYKFLKDNQKTSKDPALP